MIRTVGDQPTLWESLLPEAALRMPPELAGVDALLDDERFGAGVEDDLRALRVRYVVVPRKGRPTAARRQVEQRRAFRKMVRWRTGSEGRMNSLKRDYGLRRTRYRGIHGARTWCSHSIFNHNLTKIATLTSQ